MTIGAAIDGYKGCQKVKWEDVSGNDLKLAKVTCEVSSDVLKAEFDKQNARYEEVVQKAKDDAQRSLEKTLERIINNYNELKTEGSSDANKEEMLALANKFCKYDEEKQRKVASARQ